MRTPNPVTPKGGRGFEFSWKEWSMALPAEALAKAGVWSMALPAEALAKAGEW